MHAKYVTGVTVTDLGTDTPYLEGSTIAVLNPGASSATLQFGDASTGPFSTGHQPDGSQAIVPAGGGIDVVISGRYAALEGGSGQLQLLGN
jgi:hypothetical protein